MLSENLPLISIAVSLSVLLLYMCLCNDLEIHIFLSLFSYCPLLDLLYHLGFVRADVVYVVIHTVADMARIVIVVAVVDNLVAIIFAIL